MNFFKMWELLLPIFSIIIPTYATLYTLNGRVKNENRENHKPYLSLHKILSLKNLDQDRYYLTMYGRNFRLLPENEKNKKVELNIDLLLQNIGYGVASNIKFYDLLTGEQLTGTQASNKEKNQKLFTTFDIAANMEKEVQLRIFSSIEEKEGIINEDHNRILCIYQDLNSNIYDMIISINVKADSHYDFFSYQPSSQSYKRWIKENKHQYMRIKKDYGN